jgi:Flp pilus assembly protein TadD
LSEATEIYQRAARLHPNEPSVFNDLGLCFARQNMLPQSLSSLERAIQLRPQERLYRNNMATVLVETGNVDAAYDHLKAVHAEPVALYNLGFLMQKKGDSKGAAVLFSKALAQNPSLVEARIWLDRLNGQAPTAAEDRPETPLQASMPGRSASVPASPRFAPAADAEQGSTSRGGLLPRLRHRSASGPGGSGVQDAPLPPPISIPSAAHPSAPGPMVQPLPPVGDSSVRR